MNRTRKLLDDLVSGKISVDEAEKQLRTQALDSVGGLAMIDVDRESRSGIPEVVFGESKDAKEIVQIVKEMVKKQDAVLVTRLTQEKLDILLTSIEDVEIEAYGKSPILTALVTSSGWSVKETAGRIAVITAGTSDIPFAKEAEALAKLVGVEVLSYYDIGVSGIHRLIEPIKEIVSKEVDALIVFAGMEGALPTVVAALVDIPVIGVPVPTGYGFGGKGETALASMLQSCSPGLAVVNIGNGLGAASVASLIAKRAAKNRS
ncbi:MAG: nickel pincer cofactor biosynthesis protein LarB [Candidatus Thorarchaeota archaeon]